MNEKQRSEYWLKVERLRRKLDNKYAELIYGVLDREVRQFARKVEMEGPEAARSSIAALAWDDKLYSVMREMYKESAVVFGNAGYRAVGVESRKAYDPFEINTELLAAILAYLVQWGFYLVALMTQTTKKRLQEVVTIGVANGLSKAEIAKLIISDDISEYIRMRAVRIARTEVMRSSNYAIFVGAGKHSFEVDKVWVSVRDARTRRIPKNFYDHFDMDGQTRRYDEMFISTDRLGRVFEAMMPGDPTTPKGFTINCRCTLLFVPRRDANGKLILKR